MNHIFILCHDSKIERIKMKGAIMTDKFSKVILTGILFCLIIIAFKTTKDNNITTPTPNVNIDNVQRFVQIAPNRIGIVDTGTNTGYRGQLVIFDFDEGSKTFKYVETLKASYILDHPEEFGIPVRK